jgi:hypothetical protein
MKPMTLSAIAALPATMALVKIALVSGAIVTFAPATAGAIEKKGSTSYTSQYVFRPVGNIDVPNVGKVTAYEMAGPTVNTKGEPTFDKMQARCFAVSVDSAGNKWIDGACSMTDNDGDVVFSTFDTRDLDRAQPAMDCGTHTITGGTGKYKGITGREAFSCQTKPTPAGQPVGTLVIDIPHNTVWEIR